MMAAASSTYHPITISPGLSAHCGKTPHQYNAKRQSVTITGEHELAHQQHTCSYTPPTPTNSSTYSGNGPNYSLIKILTKALIRGVSLQQQDSCKTLGAPSYDVQGLKVLALMVRGTKDQGAAVVASRLTQPVWPHHENACMVYKWHISTTRCPVTYQSSTMQILQINKPIVV